MNFCIYNSNFDLIYLQTALKGTMFLIVLFLFQLCQEDDVRLFTFLMPDIFSLVRSSLID